MFIIEKNGVETIFFFFFYIIFSELTMLQLFKLPF